MTHGTILAGLFSSLLLTACSPRHVEQPELTVRVMTFNIRHGRGLDDQVDIRRIARIINNNRADIVALQEVDRGVERSGRIDIMTALADLTGMAYAFGKNIDFQGGSYGNGFLTRFPIFEERNRHYAMLRPGEQRGLLTLILDVRGTEVLVANTHLDYREDDAERLSHVEEILETVGQRGDRPALLFGDLNDIPTSRTLAALKTTFDDAWEATGSGDGFTYPGANPVKRIDYVLVSKPAAGVRVLSPRSAQVLPTDASDHRPLLVEFELRGQ